MKIKANPLLGYRRIEKYMKKEAESLKKGGFRYWDKLNQSNFEIEVFQGCVILKNLSIVQKDIPLSVDYILEELRDNSKFLKHTYERIISQWRMGKDESAFEVLRLKLPTRAGNNFIMILEKIDKVNPAELTSAMNAFEETFSAERVTKALKNTERKAMVTTLAATACFFAVLMNFAVVIVFMNTLLILNQVF